MSTYATISGELTYPNQSRLDALLAQLVQDRFMVARPEGHKFVDECQQIIDELTPSDVDGLTIRFPQYCARNILRRLIEIVQGTVGVFIWTSTDGMFSGGVIRDGVEEPLVDLISWAAENMPEEDATPPAIEDENYCVWMAEVEMAFHEENA